MAEYSTLKVPELKKLLAERGLAQTGNKADLIARLNENDGDATKAAPAAEPEAAKPAENKEDEITYSDDEAAAAKPAEPAAAPAPAADDATKPAAAEGTTDAAAEATSEEKPAEPAVSYAMGLSSTAAEDEAKKRADRAKRFGIEEDDDAKKRADRASRFGLDQKELATGLDSALPERVKRGRGRQGGEDGRPGRRQGSDRRGGGRRRGGRRDGSGIGGDGGPKRVGVMDDPAEKAKAEKRAARFAAA